MGVRSIRANTSWAFIGTAAYSGSQWIVFVLLVRSLGVAEVGLFAYWVAVTGPVFVLANVRLRNILATSAGSPGDFSGYLAARLITTFSAVAVSLLVGVAVAPRAGSLAVLAFIVAARACDAVSDICHGLFQRDLDMRSASIGLMANGVGSVALVGLSLVFHPSLTWATAAYAIGSAAALFAWDLPRMIARVGIALPRRIGRETGTAAGRLIVRALPLGLSSAVGNIQINLPRYVVGAHLGPAALGVFAALSYLPALGDLVVNAIAEAGLPLLARDHRAAPARHWRRLFALVATGVGVGAVGLLATAIAGRPALAWIYGREYAQHVGVLFWLMTGAAVSYVLVFLGAGTTARSRFRQQFVISLASLLVVAGVIGPLVSQHGLAGAAWSLLAGGLVQGCGYIALTGFDLTVTEPRHVVPDGLLKGARS